MLAFKCDCCGEFSADPSGRCSNRNHLRVNDSVLDAGFKKVAPNGGNTNFADVVIPYHLTKGEFDLCDNCALELVERVLKKNLIENKSEVKDGL